MWMLGSQTFCELLCCCCGPAPAAGVRAVSIVAKGEFSYIFGHTQKMGRDLSAAPERFKPGRNQLDIWLADVTLTSGSSEFREKSLPDCCRKEAENESVSLACPVRGIVPPRPGHAGG